MTNRQFDEFREIEATQDALRESIEQTKGLAEKGGKPAPAAQADLQVGTSCRLDRHARRWAKMGRCAGRLVAPAPKCLQPDTGTRVLDGPGKDPSLMTNDNEPETVAELKASNRALAESLQRCHALVAEYRDALASRDEGSFIANAARDHRR